METEQAPKRPFHLKPLLATGLAVVLVLLCGLVPQFILKQQDAALLATPHEVDLHGGRLDQAGGSYIVEAMRSLSLAEEWPLEEGEWYAYTEPAMEQLFRLADHGVLPPGIIEWMLDYTSMYEGVMYVGDKEIDGYTYRRYHFMTLYDTTLCDMYVEMETGAVLSLYILGEATWLDEGELYEAYIYDYAVYLGIEELPDLEYEWGEAGSSAYSLRGNIYITTTLDTWNSGQLTSFMFSLHSGPFV